MLRKLVISSVAAATLALSSGAAIAAGGAGYVEDYAFSFEGPFRPLRSEPAAARSAGLHRGLCGLPRVCAYVPIRTLSDESGPGLSEEEVRAYIEQNFIEVWDPELRDWRAATPNDNFPTSSLEKRARPQPDDQGTRGLFRGLTASASIRCSAAWAVRNTSPRS